MRYNKAIRYVVLIALTIFAPAFLTGIIPRVHAATYSLGTIPFLAQEGSTFTVVFTVYGATGSTFYQFRFWLKDPATKLHSSALQNYTTSPGQNQFTLPVFNYPTPSFSGPNDLVGQYFINATQVTPFLPNPNVAQTYFLIFLTDKYQYQRTDTVNVQATGYNILEPATVKIATASTPSTTVFTQNTTASPNGVVVANWHIPRNATIDPLGYIVTVTGRVTVKTPADVQGFYVRTASMSVSSLNSLKSTYQRTETMLFSFQPVYPDGSNATSGTGTVTLTDPIGTRVNLTATYDSVARSFQASYKTSISANTGHWNATLIPKSYNDGYGNDGPDKALTSLPQLVAATLAINANVTTYVAVGQQLKLNATITYPDGSALQSGTVAAFLLYSGGSAVNDTVPIVFDSGLKLWVGSYALQSTDPGGLWSLVIRASDSPTPPNTGSATKAVTTQDHPPVASFNPSAASAVAEGAISFNATASYDPDGNIATWSWTFGDGTSGSGPTASHAYNTPGTYTVTLTVTDNSGSTASTTYQVTITSNGSSGGNVSLPLYLFGILAAIIAAMFAGGFLAFRRHRVTHAKLKIDLEAVKSEAGRIENQEFFQSVKDQLRKDKDD